MQSEHENIVIVGGGIVGLGIGIGLLRQSSKRKVVVLETESELAQHGSGRNSGVLHAGFYYTPDSLKAKLTRRGNEMLKQLCHDEGINVRSCGKVVVAQNATEVQQVLQLHRRAEVNGVITRLIDESELAQLEPLARTHSVALWSPNTAVADPKEVTKGLARVFSRLGGQLRLGMKVRSLKGNSVVLGSGQELKARHIVNAAGLYADKLAHSSGVGRRYRMLPFKGLYLYGDSGAPQLQRHVYPVPDPRNPFLGVHLTVTANGQVKIGPTAIPVLSRQNYARFQGLRMGELLSIAELLPQFLLSEHHDGLNLLKTEVPKYFRKVLVRHAADLVPSAQAENFSVWGRSGIRAQLFDTEEQRLEMDFVIESTDLQTHVLNAVSPAWTGALSFGEHVATVVFEHLYNS
jgi:(S)-2-hydroxyglutarate dehydrogenase